MFFDDDNEFAWDGNLAGISFDGSDFRSVLG